VTPSTSRRMNCSSGMTSTRPWGVHSAPPPNPFHVASESIAKADPALTGPLLGDRAHSKIFDNAKTRHVDGHFSWIRSGS